jgi:hypothetical protein
MRRAILALTFAAVLACPATAAAQAPTVAHVWRANLDGDAHVEHVRLMRKPANRAVRADAASSPYSCV